MKKDQIIDFKLLSNELDKILAEIEQPTIDVDKIITKYTRGVEIIAMLKKYLKESENKVKKIKADL